MAPTTPAGVEALRVGAAGACRRDVLMRFTRRFLLPLPCLCHRVCANPYVSSYDSFHIPVPPLRIEGSLAYFCRCQCSHRDESQRRGGRTQQDFRRYERDKLSDDGELWLRFAEGKLLFFCAPKESETTFTYSFPKPNGGQRGLDCDLTLQVGRCIVRKVTGQHVSRKDECDHSFV